jgi:hypothetical protein
MTARRLLAATALLLLAAACKDSTGSDPGLVGTFTLKTVAGKTLPWIDWALEQDTAWVLGGSYVFRADSTYTFTYDYRYKRSGVVTLEHYEDVGRYRAIGDSLQLSDWWDYGARRDGRTLVVHGRDNEWVYRR